MFALTTRSLLTRGVPCARCTRAIIQCRNWIRSPNPHPRRSVGWAPSAVLPRNYIFYEGVCRKWYLMSTDQTGSDPGCMHVADNQCDGKADVRQERRKTSGPWSLQLMCPRKWRKRNVLECPISGHCIKLLRLLVARSTVHRSVTGLSIAPVNTWIRFFVRFSFRARFGTSQCDDNIPPDREILLCIAKVRRDWRNRKNRSLSLLNVVVEKNCIFKPRAHVFHCTTDNFSLVGRLEWIFNTEHGSIINDVGKFDGESILAQRLNKSENRKIEKGAQK